MSDGGATKRQSSVTSSGGGGRSSSQKERRGSEKQSTHQQQRQRQTRRQFSADDRGVTGGAVAGSVDYDDSTFTHDDDPSQLRARVGLGFTTSPYVFMPRHR